MMMDNARAQRIAALAYDYDAQPKETVEHCNLCGGAYLVQISQRDRYGYKAGAFACGRCGLVFLSPRLSADAYNDFYARTYRPLVSAYHGRLIDAKSIQGEQGEYAKDRADFCAPFLKPRTEARLLDIGGSTGVVAREFAQRFGYRGVVLDPSADELREAQAHGLETVQGFMETADFGGQKFELILLCQTVDHLLDIDGTLDKVQLLLAPGGIFLVDIVDFRAGYLRHWSVSEALKIDHPFYLTQETMEAFLKRKGFAALRKGYAADHLHISYVCELGKAEPRFLPEQATADAFLREIRTVQNAPRGAGL
jgi:ubiquinone/menaquinone biosynthesis C-methylase UbiE